MHRRPWPTRQELTTAVFKYSEGLYNPRRRHQRLRMLSPVAFEDQHAGFEPARAEMQKTSRRVENPLGLQHQQRLLQTSTTRLSTQALSCPAKRGISTTGVSGSA